MGLMHLWVQVFARYNLWLHVLRLELGSCKNYVPRLACVQVISLHFGLYYLVFIPDMKPFATKI